MGTLKKYPKLAIGLEEYFDSVLAVLNVPPAHRKRLRTMNHIERVNQELRQRGRTIPSGRIQPAEAACTGQWGTIDEATRTLGRHYLVKGEGE
jgi:transposase-like protein